MRPWPISVALLIGASPFSGSASGRPVAAGLPAASGPVGPFAHAAVALARTGTAPDMSFAGVLATGRGVRLPLAGPDEPAAFFLVEPTAVLLAPVDRTGRNGVVVLYDSSQIGPGHGTRRRALVYRVEAAAAVRQPALEARLAGCATADAARRRLAATIR